MTRPFTVRPSAMLVLLAGMLCPIAGIAQVAPAGSPASPEALLASRAPSVLQGVVADDRGQPLAGVIVSALGTTSAFAVSDRAGAFTLRDLPQGPYLVRAHLLGYAPARARIVQVSSTSRDIAIALARLSRAQDPPQLLQAGMGNVDVPGRGPDDPAPDDHSELAWRLRHVKRSVLKDADYAVVPLDASTSFMEDSLSALGRAVGASVRLASGLVGVLPVNGQINFLTRTSFDRAQDVFSAPDGAPSSLAFVSLSAPTTSGTWSVRGGATQGDLSTWLVAGSYVSRPSHAAHQYRASLSYARQRNLEGGGDGLAAVVDSRRNAGEMAAFDDWTPARRLEVSYGARYARYDYLSRQNLLSPRATLTLTPMTDAGLRVRGTVSRRELAPGAEEFLPPSTAVWLPPGRTFSPASVRSGFGPERVDHLEIAIEQPVAVDLLASVRVFRQQVSGQLVTLFGVNLPDGTTQGGRYYVGNAGDVDVRGWGASLSRIVGDGVRASVDYSQSDGAWVRQTVESLAAGRLTTVAHRQDPLRDLTTSVEGEVPGMDTRVFVIYKINSGFAGPDAAALKSRIGTRFDVQVSQALPFLNFTNAQWEMLVAVRNLFREESLDASVYDELLVVRPPKHVVGGVTVRF